jgi:hypothetical protein
MTNELAREALKTGYEQARQVLAFRAEAQKNRQAAVQALSAAAEKSGASLASATAGVLVAEGDSWFDYPFYDIIEMLEDDYAFEVESVAHKGDAAEEMAYSGGQLEELTRRLEKLLRRGTLPRAILLSAGGNDIVGDEFHMIINHAASRSPGINRQVMEGVIGERLAQAYVHMLGAVTHVCTATVGAPVPILIHGYDYPVPDGRGYLGGWWLLPGPWMDPGFRRKGYADLTERIRIVKELIDAFNRVLIGVARLAEFQHVRHVDLRGALSNGADYKVWWDNELHPTRRGFAEVTRRFVAAIP